MQKHHRGERRFQTERLKKKRQYYWGYHPTSPFAAMRRMPERTLGMLVNTPAICSCMACSGTTERKLHGNGSKALTVQELSHAEVFRKGLI